MGIDDLVSSINQYGFPIIAALGLGYFVFYVWKWATEQIDEIISETMVTLIKLVDRVRMLDNDLIRLNTKLAMILEYKAKYENETGGVLDLDAELDEILEKTKTRSKTFNSTGKE